VRHRDVQSVRMRTAGNRDRYAHRGGFLAPAVVVALLAMLFAVALVLDTCWLENASVELTRVSEAAALTAGRELVTDDLLRDGSPERNDHRRENARRAAVRITARNRFCGETFQAESALRIHFGRLVRDPQTGETRFEETAHRPRTVVVAARCSRRYGNPVALFLRGLTGQSTADLMRRAEATVDNHVVGVRPFDGAPAPMWPLAILEDGAPDGHVPTWNRQIEQRAGRDDYSYNEDEHRVLRRPDGIPEIVLRCGTGRDNEHRTNVKLVDLGNGLRIDAICRQVRRGVTAGDLQPFAGQLRMDEGPLEFEGYRSLPPAVWTHLQKEIGVCRIVLLYSRFDAEGEPGRGRVHCPRFVAGRVMDLRRTNNGSCEIIFQPGTLTTRTAVLAARSLPASQRRAFRNRYIYKLHLTH